MISSNSRLRPSSQPAKRSWRSARSSFGMPLVRGVADEDVAEAERVLDRIVRPDQLLSNKSGELARLPGGVRRARARRARPTRSPARRPTRAREARARSSGSPSSRAASSAWIVGGTSLGATSLGQHREQLLDEERIALGHFRIRDRASSSSSASRAGPRSARRSPAGQRLERDRVAAHAGRTSRKLRSGEAEEQHRRIPRPVGEMLDQVEQRRLGPVDVLEDERQRMFARPCLEPFRTSQTTSSGSPRRRATPVAPRAEPGGRSPTSGQYVMPSPYGRHRPDEHARLALERRGHLAGESRLADARRPEHGHEVAATLGDRLVERRPHARELLGRPTSGASSLPVERRCALDDAEQPVRGDRLGLALQRERLDRLHLDGVRARAAAWSRRAGSRRARPPARAARRR